MNIDFSKYSKIDLDWLNIKEQLIKRDGVCQVWKNLSREEKNYIVTHFKEEFEFKRNILDPMHKVPRSHAPDKINDLDNLILGSRYFHELLDTYRHPVTREIISFEERMTLMEKYSKKGNNNVISEGKTINN